MNTSFNVVAFGDPDMTVHVAAHEEGNTVVTQCGLTIVNPLTDIWMADLGEHLCDDCLDMGERETAS